MFHIERLEALRYAKRVARKRRPVTKETRALAALLQHIIIKRNMTHDQLAKATGIGRSTITKLLSGENPIDAGQIFLICGALQILPSKLVREVEVKLDIHAEQILARSNSYLEEPYPDIKPVSVSEPAPKNSVDGGYECVSDLYSRPALSPAEIPEWEMAAHTTSYSPHLEDIDQMPDYENEDQTAGWDNH